MDPVLARKRAQAAENLFVLLYNPTCYNNNEYSIFVRVHISGTIFQLLPGREEGRKCFLYLGYKETRICN